ncbi:hypothetical protein BGX26_003566 [Mortierella sp. AD094]|nr:hypothetical protein BGX26_003566 [Mortierella sp. AD094]
MPSTNQGSISGWSNNVYRGTNITDVMVSMINDTKVTGATPDVSGQVYTPRISDYGIGCDSIDVSTFMNTGIFALGDTGCARVHILITGPIDFDGTGGIVTKRSSSRWSISLPVEYAGSASELATSSTVTYNNATCQVADLLSGFMYAPRDGTTSSPFTQTTKCVYPSGDITSLSLSSIRFMATTVPQFSNISKTAFDEYDELFQAMEVVLSKNNNTSGNSTMYAELKSENGTINSLNCFAAPNPLVNNTAYLTCIYVIVNAIILERQDINPNIAAAQGGGEPQPDPPESTTILSFSHIPSTDEDGLAQTLITEVKKANAATTSYLASLGQNLYVDWSRQQVTIMFETTDAEEGLEIPGWLIICVPIVAVISALLLGSTEYFLDVRYTSSLYKAIALPMRSRMNSFAPMLMRSKVGPVEFEGIPVVPSDRRFEADPNNVATLQSDSNSSITAVNGKHSSNKLSQLW